MKLRVLAAVIFVSLGLLYPAGAAESPDLDKMIDSLQEQISAAVKAKKAPEGSNGEYYEARTTNLRLALRTALARNDFNSVQSVLAQIQAAFPDESIQKLCEQILKQIADETAAKEKQYVEAVDAAVDQAVKTSLAAKSPKELDAPLLELSKLSQRPGEYNTSELVRRTSEKARNAVNFVSQWQDYLAQMRSGNTSAAQNVLRNISQNTSSFPFVSRSEVLDRMGDGDPENPSQSTAPFQVDLQGKTLKDLPAIISSLKLQLAKGSNQNELRRLSDNLTSLQKAYADYSNGMVGKTFYYCTNNSDGGAAELGSLRQELLLLVLPVYLNLDKDYPVKTGESPAEYLLRVVKESKGKGDWTTVWKTLETYRALAFSSGQAPGWLTADIQGCMNYISAQNFEKAGQYVDAVRYYKRVLSQPGENLPQKEASERLESLQKDHPDEYNTANSPDPSTNRYIPGSATR